MRHRQGSDGCFTHEFALAPTAADARELDIRMRLGRDIYNACVREGNRRLGHCFADPQWLQAKLCPPGKTRRDAFFAVQQAHGLTEAQLVQYTIPHAKRREDPTPQPYEGARVPLRAAHYYEHLDAKCCHLLAKRAYEAVMAAVYQKGHGRARIRRHDEDIALPSTQIHWRGEAIEWNSPLVHLSIPVALDPEDRDGVQAHALAHIPVQYGRRIVRRVIRGAARWYVQFTYPGQPLWKAKHAVGTGTVGLDLGPSMLASVWDGGQCLEQFCPGLAHDYAKIRRIQRYLDRSKRATNPACFAADGTVRKGARFVYSQRYLQARARYQELWRKYAARRKNELGQLAHRLIALGITIKTEALSYKAWQRQWGKSVGRAAPGMFLKIVARKCAQLGGRLIEFSTRTTKLSQFCHGCGVYVKKPLSLRAHQCACGIGPVQRDIYSAFLARHVSADDHVLEIAQVREAWVRDFNPAQTVSSLPQPSRNDPQGASPAGSASGRARSSAQVSMSHAYDTRVPGGPGNEGMALRYAFQGDASIAATTQIGRDARMADTHLPGREEPQRDAQTSRRIAEKGRSWPGLQERRSPERD